MIRQLESKSFLFFLRDHLRSTLGITCGRGSFAVHFGDHLRSRDHLRLGIICGTVHRYLLHGSTASNLSCNHPKLQSQVKRLTFENRHFCLKVVVSSERSVSMENKEARTETGLNWQGLITDRHCIHEVYFE